jgi:hypothetical protein
VKVVVGECKKLLKNFTFHVYSTVQYMGVQIKQFNELPAHPLLNLYMPGLNAYNTSSSWLQAFKTTWGHLNFWYSSSQNKLYIYHSFRLMWLKYVWDL